MSFKNTRLNFIRRRYNELLDSTWSRNQKLGKLKSKGLFKREATMESRYSEEKSEMLRLDEERTNIYLTTKQ